MKKTKPQRPAFTLIEILVVIMIIGLLLALLVPAVQAAREAGRRAECGNHLHQMAMACHMYEDVDGVLPAGLTRDKPGQWRPNMTWLSAILPYIEQNNLAIARDEAYKTLRSPFDETIHTGLSTVVETYTCPSDPRTHMNQETHEGKIRGLTSYVGVNGTTLYAEDGVFFADSSFPLAAILDGTSNTLMIGERPPSPDFWYGWWYAGFGQQGTGSVDMLLGVREINVGWNYLWFCERGPWHFQPGDAKRQCDVLHFWSLHPQGANFARADGSVHFMNYGADSILPALATRHGGE